ncbi:MFS transporter [Arthrobacter sp. UCD-GKA]|uniref:MFS transporter n=1 Tax=Arthrobacter sp. UCD-GKA TaxID=1913576 RepID=UPI000A7815E3|nr:MFS transporter [Arthrobacter sp. UCD-GKA]
MKQLTTPEGQAIEAPPLSQKTAARRAMMASYLGTTVEFYDFFIYGTAAALIFPTVFFTDLPMQLGVTLSYLTLAAGYVARPVGGILFGHFGDRVGRKRMLLITMLMMGLVSIAMGVLPGTETIGYAAPVVLVLLRLVQGIAVGGEWAGAALMALEHAQPKNRGFAASLAVSGAPSGAVLATLVFGAVSMLPQEQLLQWGWRVAFLLSVGLVFLAMYLRSRVTESPEFEREKAERDNAKAPVAPLVAVLKKHPGRLASAILSGIAPLFLQSLLATFAISYAVTQGHAQATVLWMVTIANFLMIFSVPAFAALSDRIGRRPVMLAGYIFGGSMIWIIFRLIDSGNVLLLLAAIVIGNPIANGMMYGPLGAFFSEKFDTGSRYTGVSLSYQLSTLLGAGFAPLIASSLLFAGSGGTHLVSLLFTGLCVFGALAVWFSRETRGTL